MKFNDYTSATIILSESTPTSWLAAGFRSDATFR